MERPPFKGSTQKRGGGIGNVIDLRVHEHTERDSAVLRRGFWFLSPKNPRHRRLRYGHLAPRTHIAPARRLGPKVMEEKAPLHREEMVFSTAKHESVR